MKKKLAVSLFLGREKGFIRLNCAQAIAQAFIEDYDFLTPQTVEDFKKIGHGKAPGGQCGMLYAAKYILNKNDKPEKADEFESNFKKFAGSVKCADIIKKKIPFCAECLGKTAEFIEEQFKSDAEIDLTFICKILLI